MDINDLDDEEFAYLAQWIATNSLITEVIDLRKAPAWRFAEAREAVDRGDITEFPDLRE